MNGNSCAISAAVSSGVVVVGVVGDVGVDEAISLRTRITISSPTCVPAASTIACTVMLVPSACAGIT